MKPEDKKLVAEALLEAAKAVTTSLTDLSEDDWLVVYHGTSLSEVPSLINGFDATRLKYRLYGGPKHRGLFVTPDFKTAERFAPYGEVVLELLVRVKNLHGTDYYGRTGRQQNQEQKTEEWLAGKFPNSFRPYLSLTLTQSVEPQALLIGLVSPKQILRVWHRASRADTGKWYTRNEFLALGLEAGPSADEPQGIKKKVEDLGIDLSSPRLSLDEFLDATARLADVPRSRVESALSVRAPKGEDEMVRLIERFGFQPKAAQSFARKFMKSLTNKQVAKALLAAASKLEASGSSVQASTLKPTDELISKMKKFFEHKWKTEKGRTDITGACIFATAFAEELLGGTPTGNWHHVYLDWYGKKRVDLTEAYGVREQALERLAKQKEYEEQGYGALARAMTPVGFVGPDVDPYMVDKKFLRSRDFKDTWDSVLARATRWADEFRESLNNES